MKLLFVIMIVLAMGCVKVQAIVYAILDFMGKIVVLLLFSFPVPHSVSDYCIKDVIFYFYVCDSILL